MEDLQDNQSPEPDYYQTSTPLTEIHDDSGYQATTQDSDYESTLPDDTPTEPDDNLSSPLSYTSSEPDDNLASPGSTSSELSSVPPGSETSEGDLMLSDIQARLDDAVETQVKNLDFIRKCQSDLAGFLDHMAEKDGTNNLQQEHAAALQEIGRLRNELHVLKLSCEDITRGNLELLQFQAEVQNTNARIYSLNECTQFYQSKVAALEAKLKEREADLHSLRMNSITSASETKESDSLIFPNFFELQPRLELDQCINARFSSEAKHGILLREMVDAVGHSTLKDVDQNVQSLRSYVEEMSEDRLASQAQWQNAISQLFKMNSPNVSEDENDFEDVEIKTE